MEEKYVFKISIDRVFFIQFIVFYTQIDNSEIKIKTYYIYFILHYCGTPTDYKKKLRLR